MKNPKLIRFGFASLCVAILAIQSYADNSFALDPHSSDRIVNLRGSWRFSIGDDAKWADPEFNDSSWNKIHAPDTWESEGYHNYNGYAWYRKSFSFPSSHEGKQTFIALGEIDDVDQVFVNGQQIGSTGQFPPNYVTAYNHRRTYLIPPKLLNNGGNNIVAIRVYDGGIGGGIKRGPLGIYETELPPLFVDLSGNWQFSIGDDESWSLESAETGSFSTIHAPGSWENQGFPNYDGFAWYRKTFRINDDTGDENMVLLLGKIDDFDEVYLNGEYIGGTGNMQDLNSPNSRDFYDQNRGYYFPASKLKAENTIAIRVYDGRGTGGIYQGPLGILRQNDYIAFWEDRRKNQSVFKDFRRFFD